jgi:predicted tellurium resistance membrane protein TerC
MLLGGGFLIWKSIKEIHNSLEGHGHENASNVPPKLGPVIGTIVLIDILFSLDSVITAVGLVGSGSAPHDGPAQMSAAARDAIASIQAVLPSMDTLPAAAQDALHKSQTGQGAGQISIMVAAIVLSMMVMLAAAKTIGDFVNRHPTVKMLALAFLILVGFVLVADGFGHHVPKGYVYFAMAFSFVVEGLNIRARAGRKTKPVELRSEYQT